MSVRAFVARVVLIWISDAVAVCGVGVGVAEIVVVLWGRRHTHRRDARFGTGDTIDALLPPTAACQVCFDQNTLVPGPAAAAAIGRCANAAAAIVGPGTFAATVNGARSFDAVGGGPPLPRFTKLS